MAKSRICRFRMLLETKPLTAPYDIMHMIILNSETLKNAFFNLDFKNFLLNCVDHSRWIFF
jgi:hypothetical protein